MAASRTATKPTASRRRRPSAAGAGPPPAATQAGIRALAGVGAQADVEKSPLTPPHCPARCHWPGTECMERARRPPRSLAGSPAPGTESKPDPCPRAECRWDTVTAVYAIGTQFVVNAASSNHRRLPCVSSVSFEAKCFPIETAIWNCSPARIALVEPALPCGTGEPSLGA